MITTNSAVADTSTQLPATSWAYIDSAAPDSSFVNPKGTAPVGAHVYASGTNHVSKSYFTFDLKSLRGNRLDSAYLSTSEAAVTDCANPRATEAWLTAPATKPTWHKQPTELVKADGPYIDPDCPASQVTWTVTAAIRNALDAGRTTASFVLRLPESQQSDPNFGREYGAGVRLLLNYDQPPAKPGKLTVNYRDCTAKPLPISRQARLAANVTDPDETYPGAEFSFWPADHPDQRTTVPQMGMSFDDVWVSIDQYLAEGITYAWQVRGKDYSGNTGAWSATCKFTTDFTSPANAPVVTSADYPGDDHPTGGSGVPGLFTFDAKGDQDVVGFDVGESVPPAYVAADRRGGKATFRYTPAHSGFDRLLVRSVDASGNSSPSTSYRFWVDRNEPSVKCTPTVAYVGEPRQCTFSPYRGTAVAGYVYHLGQQPDETVPAGPDGTTTVTVYPEDPAVTSPNVVVRAKLAGGYLTAAAQTGLAVDPGTPEIETLTPKPTAGLPAQFKLRAVLPGSATFTYAWDGGDPVTVPVAADGTAVVTVTPGASGWRSLTAFSTKESGLRSGTRWINVDVASNKPAVTSAEYPDGETSGAVGTPGTFVFSSPVPGVVSYTYQFSGESPVTVPAGPDGTASVVFTPTRTYVNGIFVTSKLADGTVSEEGGYWFYVAYMAPHWSCDVSGWSVVPGQHIQCTLTPVQANLVSYGYAVDSGPETTVPAGADGTATIGFTVPEDKASGSYVQLRVWSTNATGTRSDESGTSFYVYVSSSASARGTTLAV